MIAKVGLLQKNVQQTELCCIKAGKEAAQKDSSNSVRFCTNTSSNSETA